MRVRIPSPLLSYTGNQKWVSAEGQTVDEVLLHLNEQFPGLRFRVVDEQRRLRKHMKIFLNDESVTDLSSALCDTDELTLMQALSGG